MRPTSAPRSRAVLIGLLLVIFAAAGLWVSYHAFRWQWHVEGDIAGPYLIWKQVLRDGPGVLAEWRYAQDSWLFSLTLPDFILLALTGNSPWALLHQGWALMLLNAALTYAILSMVVSRTVAVTIAIAMLFAGPAAVGGVIYLSYPVTHNISLVWGLAAIWLYLKWLRTGRWLWLGAANVALFVGTMSDPWLSAALLLPVVLGALVTVLFARSSRVRYLAVAFTALVVFGLARSRVLTLLWFLPGSDFALASSATWLPHMGWIATYASLMFNAIPVRQPGFGWMPPVWLIVVDCLLLAFLTGWAIWRLLQHWRMLRAEALFLAATAVIGCAGIMTAFVISNVNPNLNVGRYIANWFYFVPVILAVAAFSLHLPRPDWLKRAVVAWCALLVVSGVAAEPEHHMSLPGDIALPETRELIRFLDEHGLTYGYAPFWATHGAAAEWLSGGRIVIRPVHRSSSGHIAARIAQTFPSWFESRDVPPGQKTFFFLAAQDDEMCPDIPTCEAMARREWGEPQKILSFHGIPVMVWDHPTLTGLPPAAVIAAAPVLQPGVPVVFSQTGTGGALQGHGWSGVEEKSAWTEGHRAVLKIHLPDGWTGPATLRFEAAAFPSRGKRNPQKVAVVADGRVLANWTVVPWFREPYEVTLPADIAEKRLIALVLEVPGATRPSDLRYVFDIRSLGIYVTSVTLQP